MSVWKCFGVVIGCGGGRVLGGFIGDSCFLAALSLFFSILINSFFLSGAMPRKVETL